MKAICSEFDIAAYLVPEPGMSPRLRISRGGRVFRSPVLSRVFCFLLLLSPAFGSNHPGIEGKNANCASCHSDMTQGQSVHSQGELACNLCHTSRSDAGGVEFVLAVPKQQLCFTCHERSAMEQHATSSPKKDCLGCHDAHRSARAMLLRRDVEAAYAQQSVIAKPQVRIKKPPQSHLSPKHSGNPRPAKPDHDM